jgi:hypothetical protein
MNVVLAPNALRNIRLGLSVSESPDLTRLGLMETHFQMALAELARSVLCSGGYVAYGGHLRADGYTVYLANELDRYNRRDRPLLVCLSWTEHRKLTLTALEEARKQLRLIGNIVYLDSHGNEVSPTAGRAEEPPPAVDAAVEKESLTALRRYMTTKTQGRILIGGKRADFQGDWPGVLEEAILAMEAKQPIYVAGGFGGITWDIGRALNLCQPESLPALPVAPAPDQRAVDGITRLVAVADETKGASLNNGLTMEENCQLASSYRPSEIAALVSLGLGRLFVQP